MEHIAYNEKHGSILEIALPLAWNGETLSCSLCTAEGSFFERWE